MVQKLQSHRKIDPVTNEPVQVLCIRCHGRKKLFRINAAYSYTDCGGVQVDCPMCGGKGYIDPPEVGLRKLKEKEKMKEVVHQDDEIVKKKKISKKKEREH